MFCGGPISQSRCKVLKRIYDSLLGHIAPLIFFILPADLIMLS